MICWQTCFRAPSTFDCSDMEEHPIEWSGSWHENGCIVVSKDGDFHRLAVLRGAPPKFVWVRLGNCRTVDVANLLRSRYEDIVRFNAQDEATVLELG